jgi:alkylation response protein AidB-like acyl-CoA dehydrogenase
MDSPARSTAKISRDELVERTRALIPMVRDAADAGEKRRSIAPETMAAIRQTGIFRILQPERFGGFEYDFGTVIRINSEIGRGCTSTAWVCGLGMTHQWIAAGFPPQAQEDVWGDDPDAIIFGSYGPIIEAKPVEGGWIIGGCWSFASGCDHGEWGLLGARFPGAGPDGAPAPGFMLVPKADYTIKDDWFTNGLAATGSKSIVCEDVFVPSHRQLLFADVMSGNSPGYRASGRPLYSIPMFAGIPVAISGPALGALQGAIDAFIGITSVQKTRGMRAGSTVADFAAVQSAVAEACAAVDAGRLMILRDLRETHEAADAGQEITAEMRLRNRLTQAYILKLAVQAIDALYSVTGVNGINLGNQVERAWRDIHAMSHHVTLNWDITSTMYGQHRLGLPPRGNY